MNRLPVSILLFLCYCDFSLGDTLTPPANSSAQCLNEFDSACASISPIAIRWIRMRSSELGNSFREELRLAKNDRSFLEPMEGEYRLQGECVRSRCVDARTRLDADGNFLGIEREALTVSFDGERLYLWAGERPDNKMLTIRFGQEMASSAPDGKLIPIDFLKYIGVSLPATPSQVVKGCTSYLRHQIENGGKLNITPTVAERNFTAT